MEYTGQDRANESREDNPDGLAKSSVLTSCHVGDEVALDAGRQHVSCGIVVGS